MLRTLICVLEEALASASNVRDESQAEKASHEASGSALKLRTSLPRQAG